MKKLALTAAALAVISAPALAADLPSRKAAPVHYVKICDVYGAGFYYVPGTNSCLKIGGYIRVQYDYWGDKTKDKNQGLGFYSRSALSVDMRTQTAWGTLQAVYGAHVTTSNAFPGGKTSAALSSYAAYIRFAGFTFGRASQPFGFMSSWTYTGTYWTGWPSGVNQLSYTALLGGGISATLSLQDAAEWKGYAGAAPYRGDNTVAVVGSLRIDQGWGSAQVMGLYSPNDNKEKGYAFGAGLGINLPQLAKGDRIEFTAVYADKAPGALFGNTKLTNASPGANGADPLYWSNPLSYAAGKGWSAGMQFRHYWSPSLRSQLHGSYINIKGGVFKAVTAVDGLFDCGLPLVTMAATATAAEALALVAVGACQQIVAPIKAASGATGKGHGYTLSHQLIWSPTKGFDMGLEIFYAKSNETQQVASSPATTRKISESNWGGRVRVQRNF